MVLDSVGSGNGAGKGLRNRRACLSACPQEGSAKQNVPDKAKGPGSLCLQGTGAFLIGGDGGI